MNVAMLFLAVVDNLGKYDWQLISIFYSYLRTSQKQCFVIQVTELGLGSITQYISYSITRTSSVQRSLSSPN